MGTLYSKIRVITTSTYTPEVFLNIVKKFNVKSLFLPPACLAEFIASDINQNDKIMESVESFLCGGSHVSNLIYDSAQILFPNAHITIGYGTSEGDLCTDSIDEYRSGSVGKLFNNHAVIIDDNDQRLGPNQTGEICFTGKIPFCGYFEDDEKTREAIYEKVFFRSGDLGYFDEDGFLFISGRKKEMLKYNNYQISASELEELIETLEEIESSCVVGVLDENTGNDTIYAFVKKIPNMNIQENDILNFVNSKVIDAKQIRGGIHFVDSFPMTPSGKIKKVEMKKLAMKINTDKNHFIHNNLSNLNNVDKKVNASVLNENKIIFKI
jgi:4-coumarate--CoA ligase